MREIFFALTILVISGCAALFKGPSEVVEFTSNPGGASVYINGMLKGKAPLQLKLETKRAYDVEFRLQGRESVRATITNRVGAGWVILDILGGIIPVVIDAATGSWYSFDQNHVNAVFEAAAEENLFNTSLFENETRLPNFRAAVPKTDKFSDEQIIKIFRDKFPNLRNKSDEEIIQMIEVKYSKRE
jgi:PEGA domain